MKIWPRQPWILLLVGGAAVSVAQADTTWKGIITEVAPSERIEARGIRTEQGLGGVLGQGVAALQGGGFAKQVGAAIVGQVAGSQIERGTGAETASCTKLTFQLDSGEIGDQCLSRWEMNSAFVVGARISVTADRSGNIRVQPE